jgi:DnaK suppressor protein
VNTDVYKKRLLDLEARLAARTTRERAGARAQVTDAVGDQADASLADETVSESLTEAELDSTVLAQVRDALKRIDAGTFGACIVDGGPIEPKRLEASPWVPYCLKHQALLEGPEGLKTSTL